MPGETITPFVLSPELQNPMNLVLPAQDFTPPDNQAPLPNIVNTSTSWASDPMLHDYDWWKTFNPTNSVLTIATPPAIADQLTTPSADSATIPGLVNNAPLAASANNPVATPGDVLLGPPESLSPAASNTIQSNSILIVAAIAAGLYFLNA
jgi:hypothetical protein